MPKNYIFAKQGKILRWQYDARGRDFGLYTEAFYNCLIIAFRSKDSKKISLIHADSTVSPEDVKAEIEWCGDDCVKIIYLKDIKEARETYTDLFKQGKITSKFEIRLIKKMLDSSGKVILDKTTPFLPGCEQPAEFESDIVFIDHQMIISRKAHISGTKLVEENSDIDKVYQLYQKKNWQTIPRSGQFEPKMRQEISTFLHLGMALQLTLHGDAKRLQNAILERGFPINTPLRDGYTMLALAAAEGKEAVVDLLIKNKANLDLAMNTGATPLFLAAGRGHIRIVQALLDAKANPDLKTHVGTTVNQVAEAYGHKKISQLIKQHQQSTLQQKLTPSPEKQKTSLRETKHTTLSPESTERSFFTLKNTAAEDYILRLHKILDEQDGDNIVQILPDPQRAGSKAVSFPSFWLKQLKREALEELSKELNTKVKP